LPTQINRVTNDDSDPAEKALDAILPIISLRPNSARHQFLAEVINQKLLPLPLVVQQIESPTLDLCGKGIGNDHAVALARSLNSMPNCKKLNLKDNNLSDRGIMCIVNAGDK
jgi:hypothetical protein